MTSRLTVPPDFSFWRTVYSHGWSSLPPFAINKQNETVSRLFVLSSGRSCEGIISERSNNQLKIDVAGSLTPLERTEVFQQVKTILRLNEDYTEFYKQAKKHPEFKWIPKIGAGRLLRSPTVFEDTVKMMCTTNCSWALTEIMTKNLCEKLGGSIGDSRFTFPTAASIADSSEKYLRKEIRAGYRSPYLLEFARSVVKNTINPESWRSSDLPTQELYEEVRSVKGVGPYAAGNILKLLGRYDYLGIDSWCRKQYSEIHRNGRTITDRVIEKHYEPFGKWKGLFFWLDVTHHWYNTKFPF